MWRSDSGAAVRRTRGSALGRERVARFAESPASERSERHRRAPGGAPEDERAENWAVGWVGLKAGRRPGGAAIFDARAACCGPPEGEASGPRGSSSRRVWALGLCPRAFGKSCQNAQVHFDDFPIKATERVFKSPAAILAGLAHRQSAEYALFVGRATVGLCAGRNCRFLEKAAPKTFVIATLRLRLRKTHLLSAHRYGPPHPRLFREATQLKTVGTVIRVAGVEVCRIEIQKQHAGNSVDR